MSKQAHVHAHLKCHDASHLDATAALEALDLRRAPAGEANLSERAQLGRLDLLVVLSMVIRQQLWRVNLDPT